MESHHPLQGRVIFTITFSRRSIKNSKRLFVLTVRRNKIILIIIIIIIIILPYCHCHPASKCSLFYVHIQIWVRAISNHNCSIFSLRLCASGRKIIIIIIIGCSQPCISQQEHQVQPAIQHPHFLPSGHRNSGHLALPGGGTDTRGRKTDGQHHRWREGDHLPVPTAVHGTTEGKCGLIPKHVHNQLACCNSLFSSLF